MHSIPHIKSHDLPALLSYGEPFCQSAETLARPLSEWSMERDDSPILRYLFRNAAPRRHLEFGTWQGFGTLCCLTECAATVWTINLPHGESRSDGSWAYSQKFPAGEPLPRFCEAATCSPGWPGGPETVYRTDSLGFIGRLYLEAGLGHRVCQILCDSRHWDISSYPQDFFDTIFIDGGHSKEVVTSDMRKALQLVRAGGLIIWHDYCSDQKIMESSEVTSNVVSAVDALLPELHEALSSLHWIDKSYLLLGVVKG
jgi:predicted O-methyltransferase YrrM